jgi:hypothetical protein
VKLTKTLALGIPAALAAIALVATGSAMAASTALCKVEKDLPCAAGNQYASNTVFSAKSTNALLDSSGTDVVCEKSIAGAKSLAQLAAPALPGEVITLTFEECHLVPPFAFSCTATTENLFYKASLAVEAGTMNGKLTVTKHEGGGPPRVAVSCVIGLQCLFSAEPVLKVFGGDPAEVVAAGIKLTLSTKEGFLDCPKEAKWSATYVATSPTSVFVAE